MSRALNCSFTVLILPAGIWPFHRDTHSGRCGSDPRGGRRARAQRRGKRERRARDEFSRVLRGADRLRAGVRDERDAGTRADAEECGFPFCFIAYLNMYNVLQKISMNMYDKFETPLLH